MAKVIVNNVIVGGNEEEAIRDGWYIKAPGGRLTVTQKLLAAYLDAKDKLEKLHALAKDALEKGGAVEADGDANAGIFEELRKSPNWRGEFIKLGGDPKAVLDKTPKTPHRMFRVFSISEEAPDGELVAPTPDGAPLPPVKKEKGD